MYRKLRAESVPLTLELATQFASMPCVPGERELKPSHTAYLLGLLENGKFVGTDWATGLCKEDGITYRLDGHHSSRMLTHLPEGVPFPAGLMATITYFEMADMQEAADAFDLFNNPKTVRSNEDRMGLFRAHVPGLEVFTRKFLMMVANGIHEYEMQRKATGAKNAIILGPRDRGQYFMYTHRPEFLASTHWIGGFQTRVKENPVTGAMETKPGPNLHFLKRPVIVAQMLTDRIASPKLADEFWHYVFAENHPDEEHETRRLAGFYREQLGVAAAPKINMEKLRIKAVRAMKHFKNEMAAKAKVASKTVADVAEDVATDSHPDQASA
jgi:hypothetical protein